MQLDIIYAIVTRHILNTMLYKVFKLIEVRFFFIVFLFLKEKCG